MGKLFRPRPLALSWYFGYITFFYLLIMLAVTLIAVSTGIYSNVMAPAGPDVTFSPNVILVSLVSLGLSLPCFLTMMVPMALDNDLIATSIASVVALLYAFLIMRFVRRRTAKKLDSYEVTF